MNPQLSTRVIFLSALFFMSQFKSSAQACTAYVKFLAEKSAAMGYSFDIGNVNPGSLFHLPPSLIKASIIPKRFSSNALSSWTWTSRFSSTVISNYSPLLPVFGVNEKGLSMAVLSSPSQAPLNEVIGQRKPLIDFQVVAYILDQAQSIPEIVRLLQDIAVLSSTGLGLHFFVASPTEAAVIEPQSNGSLKIYRKKSLPIHALANDPYKSSVDSLREGAENSRQDGLSRFEKAAVLAHSEFLQLDRDSMSRLAVSSTQWISDPSTLWTAHSFLRSQFPEVHLMRRQTPDSFSIPHRLQSNLLPYYPGSPILSFDIAKDLPLDHLAIPLSRVLKPTDLSAYQAARSLLGIEPEDATSLIEAEKKMFGQR